MTASRPPRRAIGAAVAVLAMLLNGGAPAAGLPAGAGAAGRPPSVDDPAYIHGLQWHLARIGAPAAWSAGRGKGTVVAVVDSGIDADHPDLRSKVIGQTSCLDSLGDPGRCHGTAFDSNGHGTHVAGIVAAATDNGIGIAGVAPDAHLLAVRVLTDRCGLGTCAAQGAGADVAAGIRWAVAHGADVVNISLGGVSSGSLGEAYRAALRSAWRQGVVVVAAAGNVPEAGTPRRPGDLLDRRQPAPADLTEEPVLVVTALDRAGRHAAYANPIGRARWGLAAPGGDPGDNPGSCRRGGHPRGIFSTYPRSVRNTSGYACLAGTSMAAPQVAGGAAILRGLGFSAPETVHRLLTSAHRIGRTGPNPTYGAGTLDIGRAVTDGNRRPRRFIEPRLGPEQRRWAAQRPADKHRWRHDDVGCPGGWWPPAGRWSPRPPPILPTAGSSGAAPDETDQSLATACS